MAKKKEETVEVTTLATVGETSSGFKRMEILKGALAALKRDKDKPFVVTDLSGLGIGLGNVKDIKDKQTLAMAYVTIKKATAAKKEAYDDLGWEMEEGEEFKVGGGDEATWKEVFQRQYHDITHADKVKELEELIREGEKFVKEEELEALHLEKVKKFAEKYTSASSTKAIS